MGKKNKLSFFVIVHDTICNTLSFSCLPYYLWRHIRINYFGSPQSVSLLLRVWFLLDLGTAVQWPMIARAVNNYLPWDDRNVLQPLDVFQAH